MMGTVVTLSLSPLQIADHENRVLTGEERGLILSAIVHNICMKQVSSNFVISVHKFSGKNLQLHFSTSRRLYNLPLRQ